SSVTSSQFSVLLSGISDCNRAMLTDELNVAWGFRRSAYVYSLKLVVGYREPEDNPGPYLSKGQSLGVAPGTAPSHELFSGVTNRCHRNKSPPSHANMVHRLPGRCQ